VFQVVGWLADENTKECAQPLSICYQEIYFISKNAKKLKIIYITIRVTLCSVLKCVFKLPIFTIHYITHLTTYFPKQPGIMAPEM